MRPPFHRHTELGLQALRALATCAGPMPGVTLAEAIGTTLPVLPHVMGPLVRGGWVTSGRGPGGGYALTGAASTASLLDVIEATEGPADDGVCVMSGGPCPGSPSCPVHTAWVAARQVMVDGFASVPALRDRPAELGSTAKEQT